MGPVPLILVADWFLTGAVLVSVLITILVMVIFLLTSEEVRLLDWDEASRVERASVTDPASAGWVERREHGRRAGRPTRVRVRERDDGEGIKGFVIDRSEGGVRLAVQRNYPQGDVVRVRAEEAPKDAPWVPLVVRHRRRVGDYFELGCQFEESPPWDVVVTFG